MVEKGKVKDYHSTDLLVTKRKENDRVIDIRYELGSTCSFMDHSKVLYTHGLRWGSMN